MNVIRLKFTDRKQAETVLISQKVIDKDLNFKEGTLAVVWIGTIVLEQAEYDDKMEVTKEAVLADGFHVDILLDDEKKTFLNETFPNNPKHSFAGLNEQKEDEGIL